MSKAFAPHKYQVVAENHLLDNPMAGLFLDMGLGKTVVTLSAVDRLLFDHRAVRKVLIIAPKTVADDVWSTEAAKWQHLEHLRVSKVLGTAAQRLAALRVKADIYTINVENVVWLVNLYGTRWPFDMVVLDELSLFKSHKSQRFKALRRIRPLIKRVVGLTGTPASNSLLDLWAELYLLDMGERLGKTITAYREQYFVPAKYQGHIVYSYELKGMAKQGKPAPLIDATFYERLIYEKIGDICISMKAKDVGLQMPKYREQKIYLNLTPAETKRYKKFERELILDLPTGEKLTPANAAALNIKLMQFASGQVYDEDKNIHNVHNRKLDAMEEIIEAAQGEPHLIFYWFKSDRERLLKRLKRFDPVVFRGAVEREAWNDGRIKVMLMQPKSGGHGNNLQYGGHNATWFSHTWSAELLQQGNTRIHRQGQQYPVLMQKLIVRGTIDESIVAANERKIAGEAALMAAIRAKVSEYRKVVNRGKLAVLC